MVPQVNVAMEAGEGDAHAELFFEVLREAVNEMVRGVIALVDKRVVHVDDAHPRIMVVQWREVRVVFPKLLRRCADVGRKPTWMRAVQIAHRGREHHDVAGREEALEEEPLDGFTHVG